MAKKLTNTDMHKVIREELEDYSTDDPDDLFEVQQPAHIAKLRCSSRFTSIDSTGSMVNLSAFDETKFNDLVNALIAACDKSVNAAAKITGIYLSKTTSRANEGLQKLADKTLQNVELLMISTHQLSRYVQDNRLLLSTEAIKHGKDLLAFAQCIIKACLEKAHAAEAAIARNISKINEIMQARATELSIANQRAKFYAKQALNMYQSIYTE